MTGHSKALPVVENNKNIFDDFDKIIADWLPNLCLIGVPSKASDEFLKSIKTFIAEFEGKYRIKIVEAEEDFTSQAVANKKENEDFDSKSAELILRVVQYKLWVVQYQESLSISLLATLT